MPFFKKTTPEGLAGPGYIILNTIRVMNIISLLAVVAASCVMLVKTFVVSKFFFFDACSHIITACLSLFFIVSELPFFRGYYTRNWPLLSLSSSFVTLGCLMIVTGISILGNLNKEATSQQSLGMSFWQIVISSGIVITILGVTNIVVSYIFLDRSRGVTARMIRSYGAVAPQKVFDVLQKENVARTPSQVSHSPRRSFHLGRSNTVTDTLPSYHVSPRPEMARSNTVSPRGGLNISGPMSSDQNQFAKFKGSDEVQRPDLTFHPANRI